MPRVHQFSLLTKTNNSDSSCGHRDRGNISVLSVVWLGFTALGVGVLVHATSVVQQRQYLQSSADAVALAFVQRGAADAERLAKHLQVSLLQHSQSGRIITVTIGNRHGTSSASAR